MAALLIPEALHPYLTKPPELFNPDAVAWFRAYTTHGVRGYPVPQGPDLADLLYAHAVSAREPHPLLEGMWEADGVPTLIDFICDTLVDSARLGVTPRAQWFRTQELYRRLYAYHGGGAHC